MSNATMTRDDYVIGYASGPRTPAKQARIDWLRRQRCVPAGATWIGAGPIVDLTDVDILARFARADYDKKLSQFMRSIGQ